MPVHYWYIDDFFTVLKNRPPLHMVRTRPVYKPPPHQKPLIVDRVSTLGLDSLTLTENEFVIMGDDDDTQRHLLWRREGNNAVQVPGVMCKGATTAAESCHFDDGDMVTLSGMKSS